MEESNNIDIEQENKHDFRYLLRSVLLDSM